MPGLLTRRDCAATFILILHSEIPRVDSATADGLQVDLISACYAGFLKGGYDGAMAAADTGTTIGFCTYRENKGIRTPILMRKVTSRTPSEPELAASKVTARVAAVLGVSSVTE